MHELDAPASEFIRNLIIPQVWIELTKTYMYKVAYNSHTEPIPIALM